jgi:hypothetical protein
MVIQISGKIHDIYLEHVLWFETNELERFYFRYQKKTYLENIRPVFLINKKEI